MSLIEINPYPYLTWVFYGWLLLIILKFRCYDEKLFYIFIISLIFTRSFLIDAGFFIRVSYITGIILILVVSKHGYKLPPKYTLPLSVFFIIAIMSIMVNLDLVGHAVQNTVRANFLRPAIQLMQYSILVFIMVSVFTFLKRHGNFKQTMLLMHWMSVIVALYAIYEVMSIYFHLPFLNLNNDLPSYWYIGFRRPRSFFCEPINLNNFQFFGIACSLIYKKLYDKKGIKYWVAFIIQVVVLIGSFSRSTLLVTPVITIMMAILWPIQKEKGNLGVLFKVGSKLFVILLMGFILGSFFFPDHFNIRQNAFLSQTYYGRMQNISRDLSMLGRPDAVAELKGFCLEDRLLLGIGMGNGANWRGGVGTFNSFYNQIVIYTGIVGLAIFMYFLASILFGLFSNYLNIKNKLVNRKINLIFFIGLLGMLVQRLSFPGLLTDTYLWVAFAIGIYIEQTFKSHHKKKGGINRPLDRGLFLTSQ